MGVSTVAGVSAGVDVSCPIKEGAIKANNRKQNDSERKNRPHKTGLNDKAALSWEQNVEAFCVARV
jgi:hypothetical protein